MGRLLIAFFIVLVLALLVFIVINLIAAFAEVLSNNQIVTIIVAVIFTAVWFLIYKALE